MTSLKMDYINRNMLEGHHKITKLCVCVRI
jgi:hypothetical protein